MYSSYNYGTSIYVPASYAAANDTDSLWYGDCFSDTALAFTPCFLKFLSVHTATDY